MGRISNIEKEKKFPLRHVLKHLRCTFLEIFLDIYKCGIKPTVKQKLTIIFLGLKQSYFCQDKQLPLGGGYI